MSKVARPRGVIEHGARGTAEVKDLEGAQRTPEVDASVELGAVRRVPDYTGVRI